MPQSVSSWQSSTRSGVKSQPSPLEIARHRAQLLFSEIASEEALAEHIAPVSNPISSKVSRSVSLTQGTDSA